MNRDQLEGNWKQLKGKIREKYASVEEMLAEIKRLRGA